MSEFQKEANLTFQYGESLTATAESRFAEDAPLGLFAVGITALETDYRAGERVTFVLSIVNHTGKTLPLFTLTDNLGGYSAQDLRLTPLDFIERARYFYNGVPMGSVRAVLGESGVEFPLPALLPGSACVVYAAKVNQYASPAADGTVRSVISWDDPLTGKPMHTAHLLPARQKPEIVLKKSAALAPGETGNRFLIRYLLRNSGNEAAVKAQLTDRLPAGAVLSSVTMRGIPVPKRFFQYENGLFTLPEIGCLGAPFLPQDEKQSFLTIPAAEIKQDDTGAYAVQPGEVEILLEGSLEM